MYKLLHNHSNKFLQYSQDILNILAIFMEMTGLREIRKKKGYSQLKVAIDLNISREALSYYENGKRCPSLEMLVKMSDYFHVSIDYLIRGKDFEYK